MRHLLFWLSLTIPHWVPLPLCRPGTDPFENPTTSSGKLAPLECSGARYLEYGMIDPTDHLPLGALLSDKNQNATLLPTPDKSFLISPLRISASYHPWNGTNMLSPDYLPTHWLEQRFPLTYQHAYSMLNPRDLPGWLSGLPCPQTAPGSL